MRFVQVSIPVGKREDVLAVLDAEGVDYAVTDESSEDRYEAVVSFPLPLDDIERTIDRFEEIGLSEEAWTVVLDAKTIVSDRFERQREADTAQAVHPGRTPREELQTAAEDLAPERAERWSYVAMTAVSAVVATVGLLQDSAAVVVGSMVIAPLVGPAMAASVGTVIDDRGLTTRGVRLQAFGLALAITSAAIFGTIVRFTGLMPPGTAITEIPEIQSRLAPDFLSLAVALGAGVAGAISLATGSSVALVGVMIAVALIPPAATVGIGLAWGQPIVSLGSGVLLFVNVLSINLAALVVFWFLDYRPLRSTDIDAAKATMRRRLRVLALALIALSVFLGGVTYLTYQQSTIEQESTATVRETLDEQPYQELSLQETTVRSSETAIAFDVVGAGHRTPIHVEVTVNRPVEAAYPTLATTLARRLADQTDYDVVVNVQFVDTDNSDATADRSSV